jgi:hypothetical protein
MCWYFICTIISTYDVNLIVPMTIRKPEYFNYIYNGFNRIDKHTYHFCLTASKETIYERLREKITMPGTIHFLIGARHGYSIY